MISLTVHPWHLGRHTSVVLTTWRDVCPPGWRCDSPGATGRVRWMALPSIIVGGGRTEQNRTEQNNPHVHSSAPRGAWFPPRHWWHATRGIYPRIVRRVEISRAAHSVGHGTQGGRLAGLQRSGNGKVFPVSPCPHPGPSGSRRDAAY